ncbi:IFIH1 [Mytilus coruscus]|uniref:IFIH1 n=1 Tax=Mytilus coruscus TaxID=42192 RepID=A0A6J8BYV7_MYTCO|nr:IFIH1 [Mytilus coruscus]
MERPQNDLRERIKLLLPEFLKFLKPTDVLFKIQGLSGELQEEIYEKEKISRKEAVEKLIDVVTADEDLTEKFVHALTNRGYQRFVDPINEEYPDRGDEFCQEYFAFIIRYMNGEIIENLEPLNICGFLYENQCLEDTDLDAIKAVDHNEGKHKASQELFFRIQRRKNNWPVLFMEALKDSGAEALKAKFDPSSTQEDLVRTGVHVTVGSLQNQDLPQTENNIGNPDEETVKKEMVVAPVQDNGDEEELSAQLSCTGPAEDEDGDRDQAELDSDYEQEKYMKECNEKEFSQPKEIKLRDYQLELAEKALTGKNTVICADTGSGKTWVALHIVQEHLNSKESPKVAFMARTNPLVQQQYTLFKNFLGEKKVYIINKDEKSTVPLKKLMELYDVFFFTPQILINNIEKGDTKIPQFTLLILDECHHTAKGEPYNNLMRKYIKTKHRNADISLPQIVGLTASIGVGAATTEDGAISHMIKIFSNLDVHEISTVEENKQEMKKFVAIPTEEHVKMEVCYDDPCKTIIEQEMKKVEIIYEGTMKGKGVVNTVKICQGENTFQRPILDQSLN